MSDRERDVAGGATARARERLALAVDVPGLDEAVALASELRPYFSVAKVGLELFLAEGPLAVDALADEGFRIFLDVKLHDIPNTVGHAARSVGALGVAYVTVHAAGGEAMLRAAAEGFEEGWAAAVDAGLPAPDESHPAGILAVTVLTSVRDAPAAVIAERAAAAARAGCVGVVCAAGDLATVRGAAPALLAVVPGIRLRGSALDDQARVAEPATAISSGAGLLVVGRTVTAADDRRAAAGRLVAEVEAALDGPPTAGS